MAIKDGEITRNKDIGKEEPVKETKIEKHSGEQEIKNAHASGDGSFGRNDESLPDNEAPARKEESGY